MILQTHSYYVPREKRNDHERLVRKIREALRTVGVLGFHVFEQAGTDWTSEAEPSNRFVQVIYFTDVRHQKQVALAEKSNPAMQSLIAEFCELVNLNDQRQTGLFLTGYYRSALDGDPVPPPM